MLQGHQSSCTYLCGGGACVLCSICLCVHTSVWRSEVGGQRLALDLFCLSLPFETESLPEPSSLIKQDNLAREFQESPYLCLPSARITDKHHRHSYLFTRGLGIQI